MFKSIGTWMACAAMLSSGLMAQDAPKANPIEVKEQNGEVVGSLGQERSPFIPDVTINAGWQTKQFKRGVVWDRNANADLDVNLKWTPTENSSLSIGINGRVPTRNSRQAYTTLKFSGKRTYNGSIGFYDNAAEVIYDITEMQQYIQYGHGSEAPMSHEKMFDMYFAEPEPTKINFKHDRDGNEFDERELRLSYSYTFKDVPYVGNVSVTGGWSYFKENSIYSKLNIKGYIDEFNTAYLSSYFVDILDPETGLAGLYQRLEKEANEVIKILNTLLIDEKGDLTKFGQRCNQKVNEIGYNNVIEFNSLMYKTAYELAEKENLLPKDNFSVLSSMAEMKRITSKNASIVLHHQIKWREISRQEFKFALSLDNILNTDTYILNPNMSINLEDSGHIWMQYGINSIIPLEPISDKLLWKNSIDIYWFDHDYFKLSNRLRYVVEDQNGKVDKELTQLFSQLPNTHKDEISMDYMAHSNSGFKTLAIRSSLDYAFRPNIIISPNVCLVRYLDGGLLEKESDNISFMVHDDYVIWCGINLSYSF